MSTHLIADIRLQQVAVPFGTVLRTSTSNFDAAYLLLADVTTDGGITGIGWTFGFSRVHLAALDQLAQHVVPAVIGRSAVAVQARWADMRNALERPGVVGSGAMAMAAIDIALWDVLGQVAGLPVATLLGGHRTQVEAYDSFGLWADMSLDELAADARRVVGTGAQALKLRVGGRPLSDDVARVAAVRAAIGEGASLMLDANSAWTPKQAVAAAEAFAPSDITWLEDPLHGRHRAEMADHRQRFSMPVCGGEDVYLADGADLAAALPFDVAMLDVFRTGGITGFVRAATALALRGVAVTPHMDTPTGLHLVGGLDNGVWVEYLGWYRQVLRGLPELSGPSLTVPDLPGLGFEWADDIDRYAV